MANQWQAAGWAFLPTLHHLLPHVRGNLPDCKMKARISSIPAVINLLPVVNFLLIDPTSITLVLKIERCLLLFSTFRALCIRPPVYVSDDRPIFLPVV